LLLGAIKKTGHTLQKNNEHCKNNITKTNRDGGVNNRVVLFDFR